MSYQVTSQIPHPKYKSLPGEFVYKGAYWVSWSSLDIIKKIENDFQFYSDDTLIATYPKTGTTLLQEITWLILNNADIEKAKTQNLIHRCPFLDENYEHYFPNIDKKGFIVDLANELPRPRIMKTHLLYRNLKHQLDNNPDMKILSCLRNPKDTAVSMYHFFRGLPDYGYFDEGWDAFYERWINGWISGGNYLDVTLEWWAQRNNDNVKVVFYEDMLYKRPEIIKEIAEFLNIQLTNEQVMSISEHTLFKNMKKNDKVNFKEVEWYDGNFVFMRKGEIGDWKNWFNEQQSKEIDEIYGPIFDEVGLKFIYE